jgi:UTP--glucose-1-phosphate uridylyltransferase
MKRKVTKAVFPVAGLGSRFLPATKASPKEMMPVVDKPLIQYAVEEAVEAGITDMIFITGRHKRAIEDHFDKAYELETELEARNKTELLKIVRNVAPPHVNFIFIRQAEQLGLGHAVLCAQPVLNDEPFAVLLADDLMDVEDGTPSVLAQMTALYEAQGVSILAVQDVPREQTRQYGIVKTDGELDGIERVGAIVEKPKAEEAPSTLGVVGRYILSPRIFDHLHGLHAGAGNEIQLTDAIAELLQKEAVLAYRFNGTRHDCGSKIGYLQATVSLAKKHPEVGAAFREILQKECM